MIAFQLLKKAFSLNSNNLYLKIFHASFFVCINKANGIFNLAIILLGFLIKDGSFTRLQSQEKK